MASDGPQWIDYFKAVGRFYDTPGVNGAARMGTQQLMALREVHPALYERLTQSELWPFANTMAHPELERWIGENWDSV